MPDNDSSIYEAPDRIVEIDGHLSARLDGDDGRTAWLRSSGWPAPNLHRPFLEAFVQTTGPMTRRRSSSNAKTFRFLYQRVLRFLEARSGPHVGLEDLTAEAVTAFAETCNKGATTDLRVLLGGLWRLNLIAHDVYAAVPPKNSPPGPPKPGFSDEIFAQLEALARADVEAILARRAEGDRLLSAYRSNADSLDNEEREMGRCLDELERTGKPPTRRKEWRDGLRTKLPPLLFLVPSDLMPILVLLGCVTGLNVESLKDLTSVYSTHEDRILETGFEKRRRVNGGDDGKWEIGGPTRKLRAAGSLYLTIRELAERSRNFADSDRLICVYIRGANGGRQAYPWDKSLQLDPKRFYDWIEKHHLEALGFTFNRLRTTVERRRFEGNNFEADRSAMTNSENVHFRNYLRDDPYARVGLRGITNGVLQDLEEDYVRQTSATEWVSLLDRKARVTADAVETPFVGCANILGNPDFDGVCAASFLTCFGCECAFVAEENVPTLFRLSEELEERWDQTDPDTWIERYGQAWLAIEFDVRAGLTPEEIADYTALMPPETGLTTLEASGLL